MERLAAEQVLETVSVTTRASLLLFKLCINSLSLRRITLVVHNRFKVA